MTRPSRRVVTWGARIGGAIFLVGGLYLSVFFLPYPLFPHHAERSGFSIYSDREIPATFELVFDDARRRVAAMELYRGGDLPRIFLCRSQRFFVILNRLAGKRQVGQGLVISAAGNAFLSETGIGAVARRAKGGPEHSRLRGSWSAAIAHEVAHYLVFSELGFSAARSLPVWKSEGWADYAANVASTAVDPDYDLHERITVLLDENRWRHPTGSVDRRHFRWHLLVEYLSTVEGLAFSELLDDSVTELTARNRMMSWYEEFQPTLPAE